MSWHTKLNEVINIRGNKMDWQTKQNVVTKKANKNLKPAKNMGKFLEPQSMYLVII